MNACGLPSAIFGNRSVSVDVPKLILVLFPLAAALPSTNLLSPESIPTKTSGTLNAVLLKKVFSDAPSGLL